MTVRTPTDSNTNTKEIIPSASANNEKDIVVMENTELQSKQEQKVEDFILDQIELTL